MKKIFNFIWDIIEEWFTGYEIVVPVQDTPQVPPAPTQNTPKSPNALVWTTPKDAWHNVRVICDEQELTIEQKNIVCACIYQESGFLVNPHPNINKDPVTGVVWSTDWGIVQVNDHFHIGLGKDFPSVQYVLDNPEKCVRWMIGVMKATGKLQPWSSYSTGAYKQWLIPTSKMWLLA